MKNKYMTDIVFLILIPSVLLFSCITIDMYLFLILYSIIFMYLMKYLFIKVIKDRKSATLIMYGFLFQYAMIIWIYCNAVSLGSMDHPYLVLDRDLYQTLAVNFAESSSPMDVLSQSGINYIGYPLVLGVFYKMFFPNLIVGLLLSVTIGIFNVYLSARIVRLITENNKVVFYTVLFFLISPQMNSSSTALLKDVFIISSFLMAILSFLLYSKSYYKSAFIYFLLSFLIMSMFRLSMMPLLMGLAFFIINKKFAMKEMMLLTIAIVLFVVSYSYTKQFTHTAYVDNGLDTVLNSSGKYTEHMKFNSSSFTERLIAGYDQWSLIKRFLFMPIFILIQYLTPFAFWTLNHDFPSFYIKLNMQSIWFFFLGILTIFSILNYKKIDNLIVSKMLLFGMIGYGLIAFINGGIVPRYAYPFYAILLIVIAYMYAKIKEEKRLKKKFNNFYLVYFLGIGFMGVFYFAVKLI